MRAWVLSPDPRRGPADVWTALCRSGGARGPPAPAGLHPDKPGAEIPCLRVHRVREQCRQLSLGSWDGMSSLTAQPDPPTAACGPRPPTAQALQLRHTLDICAEPETREGAAVPP